MDLDLEIEELSEEIQKCKDEEIRMQHLAWVRKDIRKKLINWSAKDHFSKELIDTAVERWNNWKEGQPAVMLFNVPKHEVSVRKLQNRITSIKIPWVEEEMQKRYDNSSSL